MQFELIDHTADVGVKVTANSLPELFKGFGISLVTLLFGVVKPKGRKRVEWLRCESPTGEDLLIDFLNEILFFIFHQKKLPVEWKRLNITHSHHYVLKSKFLYQHWDAQKLPPNFDIKSATYHNLRILKMNRKWTASVVFDI